MTPVKVIHGHSLAYVVLLLLYNYDEFGSRSNKLETRLRW